MLQGQRRKPKAQRHHLKASTTDPQERRHFSPSPAIQALPRRIHMPAFNAGMVPIEGSKVQAPATATLLASFHVPIPAPHIQLLPIIFISVRHALYCFDRMGVFSCLRPLPNKKFTYNQYQHIPCRICHKGKGCIQGAFPSDTTLALTDNYHQNTRQKSILLRSIALYPTHIA